MNSVQRSERYCDLFYCNKIDKEFHFRNFRNVLHYLRSQFLPRDYRSSVHHLQNFARLIKKLIKLFVRPALFSCLTFTMVLYIIMYNMLVLFMYLMHVPFYGFERNKLNCLCNNEFDLCITSNVQILIKHSKCPSTPFYVSK